PLGEENSVMRTTLLPGLVEALSRNYNHSAADCRLFEIGNTFIDRVNEEGLPEEGLSLCAGVYGEGADFFFLKGCAEMIFKKLGIGVPAFEPAADIPAFHPGRCARVLGYTEEPGRVAASGKGRNAGNGAEASEAAEAPESVFYGVIGELHPDVSGRFGIGERVCCLELNFDLLVRAADMGRAYKPLPKYPAVLRDIALLADDDVPVGELLRIIRQRGGRILEAAELFDVYRGRQVPEGKKSLAFGLVFRDRERTLTDEDAGKAVKKILKGLEDEAGAVLRDT
ncbi:MAG: hypothetical protein FWG03_11590, partial [Clostridiales bacterium]|nr:hypothetical protein [Clostridiales bacterium]